MPTKKPRASSPKQQAVINYGQAMFALSNSHCLARYLREKGFPARAREVETAIRIAKIVALRGYRKQRLFLDPNWKPVWPELGAPIPSLLEQEAYFREQASKQ